MQQKLTLKYPFREITWSACAIFRMEVAPLRTETGRYENLSSDVIPLLRISAKIGNDILVV